MKMENQRVNIQSFRSIQEKVSHGTLMIFLIPGQNMASIGVQEE